MNPLVTRATASHTVSFKNDHPDLMKPRPTDRFVFEKGGFIFNYIHEKTEPVKKRGRRVRIGRGRSLAEMAATTPRKITRSIIATVEQVDPKDIFMKKKPACPSYNPNAVISNYKKMWEIMDFTVLRVKYQNP